MKQNMMIDEALEHLEVDRHLVSGELGLGLACEELAHFGAFDASVAAAGRILIDLGALGRCKPE
ncbi:MAG: hypothetical protein RLZZ99_789 [Actinomycetota bacterium]